MSEEDPRFSSGAFANGIVKRGSSRSGDLQDKSLPELLKQASEQTASLVRKEIELAKAEMTVKAAGRSNSRARRRRTPCPSLSVAPCWWGSCWADEQAVERPAPSQIPLEPS
jgi:hypothetical protein